MGKEGLVGLDLGGTASQAPGSWLTWALQFYIIYLVILPASSQLLPSWVTDGLPVSFFLPPSWEVKWSEIAQSSLTLCDPMDCSLPGSLVRGIFQARVLEWVAIAPHKIPAQLCLFSASLSIAFSRQEIWSGVPFPSLGDLPDPGIKTESSALAGRFFTIEPPGQPSHKSKGG